MRYHHFTILFVIIFAVFSLRMSMSVSGYEKAADSYAKIERSFYAAADAAGEALCRYGISEIITDRGAAYDAFFNSMYASLGILDEPAKREDFLNYIPLFVVLENDAFYVYFENCGRICSFTWNKCKAYPDNICLYSRDVCVLSCDEPKNESYVQSPAKANWRN